MDNRFPTDLGRDLDQKLKDNQIEILTNSQRLLAAKIEVRRQIVRARVAKGVGEREALQRMHSSNLDSEFMRRYIEAHKSLDDAETGLMQIQISELEAQHAINQAAIEQLQPSADNKLVKPGGIIIPN
jgi:hypothetical protein